MEWRKPGPKQIRERISIGIACCRFTSGYPEILMVKKLYTYAYGIIANGKFASNDNEETLYWLNKTSIAEKYDLISLDFSRIWSRMWLNSAHVAGFINAQRKFETTFKIDGGQRLRRLLGTATHANDIWEIPKGHKKNRCEADVHCAMREFGEETLLEPAQYHIFNHSRTYSYIDAGVKYTNIYYLAIANGAFDVKLNFNSRQQIEEIADIKWMSMKELSEHAPKMVPFVRSIFKLLKKKL